MFLTGLMMYSLCGLCAFGLCLLFGAMKEFEDFVKEDMSLSRFDITLMFLTFIVLLWLLWPIFVLDVALDMYNEFKE